MRPLLDKRGRLIPPNSYAEGRARQRELVTNIQRIERQLADPNRALRFPVLGQYEAWKRSAEVALTKHLVEEAQLRAWLEADREKLLRRAWEVLQDVEPENADEEQLMQDLEEHFEPQTQTRRTG